MFRQLFLASVLFVGCFHLSTAQSTTMSTFMLTWDVIGVDSNNNAPDTGPQFHPVAIRATNIGSNTATGCSATFSWLGSAYQRFQSGKDAGSIDFTTASTTVMVTEGLTTLEALIDIQPGTYYDFWFAVKLETLKKNANYERNYTITVSCDNAPTVSAPKIEEGRDRLLYIELLVSQNRNSITSVTMKSTVYLGSIEYINFAFKTATNGYEQVEAHLMLVPNTLMRKLSANQTYTANTSPISMPLQQEYGDACTWYNINRTCSSTGKIGDDGVGYYSYAAMTEGTSAPVQALIYDFSGSSYHYNSDFATFAPTIVTIVNPIDGFTKTLEGAGFNLNDATYSGTFRIVYRSIGDQPLEDVQIEDDLAATFAGITGATVAVDSVTMVHGTQTLNINYDGVTDINLLLGTEPLGPEKNITILISFTLDNIPGGFTQNFNNTAIGCFTGQNNVRYCDAAWVGDTFDSPEYYPWAFEKTVMLANDTCSNSVGQMAIVPGNNVTYCYRVVNNGPETLTNIAIVDDNATPGDNSDDFTVVIPSLTAGASAYATSPIFFLDLPTERLNTAVGTITPTGNYMDLQKDDTAYVDVYNPYENDTCSCQPKPRAWCLRLNESGVISPNTCGVESCPDTPICDVAGTFTCSIEYRRAYEPCDPFEVVINQDTCCNPTVVIVPVFITPTPIP